MNRIYPCTVTYGAKESILPDRDCPVDYRYPVFLSSRKLQLLLPVIGYKILNFKFIKSK